MAKRKNLFSPTHRLNRDVEYLGRTYKEGTEGILRMYKCQWRLYFKNNNYISVAMAQLDEI